MGTLRVSRPMVPVVASVGLLAVACTTEPMPPPPTAIEETPVETVTGTEQAPAPADPVVGDSPAGASLGNSPTSADTAAAPVEVPSDPAAYEPVRLGPPLVYAAAGSATVLPGHFAPGAPDLTVPVNAAPLLPARELLGAECPGFVPAEPAVRLEIDAPTRAVITAPAGNAATVLLLRSRAGVRCEIAPAGVPIRIEPLLIRGTLEIWSGSLDGSAAPQGGIEISQGLPSFEQAACDADRLVRMRPGAEAVTVAGNNSAQRGCESAFNSEHCTGYFDTTPGPCLFVEEDTWVRVDAQASGFEPVPTVLRGDSPSHRSSVNSDGGQRDAHVLLQLGPGLHSLHMGATELGAGGAWSATVTPLAAPPVETELPATGCLPLQPGTPTLLNHTHGEGDLCELTVTSRACVGTIDVGPGACFTVAERMDVTLTVDEAHFDSTLTLQGANTLLFADDGGEFHNPGITATLEPGRYTVRTGSVGEPGLPGVRLLLDPH